MQYTRRCENYYDGIITMDEVDGVSEDLIEAVKLILSR